MKGSAHRWWWAGCVALWVGVFLAAEAFGQHVPQVGDEVEVRRTIHWEAAEVVQVLGRGRAVRVRIKKSGLETMLPINRVRAAKQNPPAGPTNANTQNNGFRTWRDKSGKYEIEAKFKEFDGESVHLEKRDGSAIKVLLEKLSAEDIAFVAKANVPQPHAPDNPFSGPGSASSPIDSEAPATASKVTLTSSDRSTARQLIPSEPAEPTYEPDLKVASSPPATDQPIPLPGKTKFFEKVTGIVARPECGAVLITRTNSPPGKPAQTHLDRVDLESGKHVSTVPLPAKTSVLDTTGRHKKPLKDCPPSSCWY